MARNLAAFVLVAGVGLAAAPASAEDDAQPIVEKVEILRNQYLQSETLSYYISTKPGDAYDEFRLREDFRRLWDTGFLDDLLLDVRDGAKGKIVSFVVRERKRIEIVDYRGSKALTTSNIEDELKKKEATIKVGTFYDEGKARRVDAVILDMLKEKGLTFASVKHDVKNVGSAGAQLSFVIDEGPKTKVKEIAFTGNEVFSDGTLRRHMAKIKRTRFLNFSWLTGKNKFSDEKWQADQGKLRDFYLDHGYVTATVGEPKVSYEDGRSGLFKKKPVKWQRLEIPVTEGEQYRVGEVKLEGLTVFKEPAVRSLFKLQTGDVYRESQIKKGFDKLRDVYGANGYFQFTGYPKRAPDPDKKTVDVTLALEEDKKYYVGRINFTGNDTTRDKVIRREVFLNEGDVFNSEALKLSIRRINQLGYFKEMDQPPDLEPSRLGEDKLDVTFKLQEQNRNQFTFGAGVSGIEGTFVNASFSTANFLGLGETLSFTAQTGQRSRNLQFAVTEPYFLDRPITAGFDVFLRRIEYFSSLNFVGFSEQDQGVSLTSGFAVGRFSHVLASYGYQIVDIYGVDQKQLSALGLANASYLQPGRRYESRLTPSWVRSTVDSPYTPRTGTKETLSFELVGGPLGGSVSYYSPTVESVLYHPVTRRTALGLHAESAFIIPFSSTTDVPYYRRFFLGGENQIRGFDLRSVSPIDARTKAATGGNKYVLFNAEYYFDLFGPLRFLLFYDAGEAYLKGQSIDLRTLSTSTGAEVRFLMPVVNLPFRLIYAWNPNRAPTQKATSFRFAVGTTF